MESASEIGLALPKRIDISTAAALRDEWGEWLENAFSGTSGASTATLDASSIDRIDTAGLQLLVAVAGTIHDLGHSVAWDSPSDSLRAAAADLGLTNPLQLDPAEGAANTEDSTEGND